MAIVAACEKRVILMFCLISFKATLDLPRARLVDRFGDLFSRLVRSLVTGRRDLPGIDAEVNLAVPFGERLRRRGWRDVFGMWPY